MTARWIAAACLAALVAAGAGASQAASYKYTLTGFLAGSDAGGYFGPAGGVLNGQAFTLVVRLDDMTPGARVRHAPGWTEITGSGAASPAPALLTINGHTETFGLGQRSRVAVSDNAVLLGPRCNAACAGAESFSYSADDVVESTTGLLYTGRWRSLWFDFSAQGQDIFANADLRTAFAVSPMDALGIKGGFRQTEVMRTGNGPTRYVTDYNGRLQVTSMTSAQVPEPGTWSLMILGFAALGAALRRQRLAGNDPRRRGF